MLLKRKDVLAHALSLLGIGASAALTLVLWLKVDGLENNALTGFNGYLIVDHFALFFKFLILGATGLVIVASHNVPASHPGVPGRILCALDDGLGRADAAGCINRTGLHLRIPGTERGWPPWL